MPKNKETFTRANVINEARKLLIVDKKLNQEMSVHGGICGLLLDALRSLGYKYIIDPNLIRTNFPLFSKQIAITYFDADFDDLYWWPRKDWSQFSGRMRFFSWLYMQYCIDNTKIKI